jgi:hypothetical protein
LKSDQSVDKALFIMKKQILVKKYSKGLIDVFPAAKCLAYLPISTSMISLVALMGSTADKFFII